MAIASGLSRPDAPARALRAPTPTPLARLQGWPYWLIPAAMLCGLLAYIYLLTSSPMDPIARRQIISEAGQVVSLIVAFTLCLITSFHAPRGRTRWAWRSFAAAFAIYAAAETTFGYESIVIFAGQATPTPTVADALYLPFYPLMIIGLLLLPSATLSGSSRARVLLDAAITTSALFGFGLIALIAPYFQGETPPFTLAVLVAYPTSDSILVLALILLLARGVQPNYRPVLFWLVLGLLSFIFADISFDYASLNNDYIVGAITIDPFWALGELLMSLAPLHLLIYGDKLPRIWVWLENLAPQREGGAFGVSLRRVLLPYLSVLALLVLLFIKLPPGPADSAYQALEALIVVVVFLIVGRQVLLGRDLVDAQESNKRAQQLDDLKNQFISSVNHELRTPLMTMQTYIELLRERHTQIAAPERGTIIEEVGRTSDALVDLVQSILEVRRLDQETSDFPREAVPVHAVLAKAIALVNPYETQKVHRSLRVEVPHELAIWGEPVRLQQILTNLLTNAVKYSPPGSDVEVTAFLQSSNRRGRRSGEMVEITVRDHGLGIPPEEAPLLFNRFVRLPRDLASKVVGSGLGLYLCRTLTEAMGGSIWVESTGIPGEGSTFHVLLPAAQSQLSARTAGRSQSTPLRQQPVSAMPSLPLETAGLGDPYIKASLPRTAVASRPYSSQPYSGQPAADQPYTAQPFSGQPAGGQAFPPLPPSAQPYTDQPFSGQPYPAQPYPEQALPNQPYADQPYPARPYPPQPTRPKSAQSYPAQPAPAESFQLPRYPSAGQPAWGEPRPPSPSIPLARDSYPTTFPPAPQPENAYPDLGPMPAPGDSRQQGDQDDALPDWLRDQFKSRE